MEAKFKKRKKKVRKVKRSETVKADDLLPLEDDANRWVLSGAVRLKLWPQPHSYMFRQNSWQKANLDDMLT